MHKIKILIPVYNDWKPLNKLLIEIDKSLNDDSSFTTHILNYFKQLILNIKNKSSSIKL